METKIASYQENGIRLQLVKISYDIPQIKHNENFKPDLTGTIITTHHYQIRKNRKVICNIKWEYPARQKFLAMIQQELLQTKLHFI